MTQRYTAEMGRLIGDPTDTFVAERLLLVQRSNRPGQPISGLVLANAMCAAGEADDVDDAYELMSRALAADEVVLQIPDDWQREEFGFRDIDYFTLDDVWRLRLERRERYWDLDGEGKIPPAHIPGECMIARGAIVDWMQRADEYAPCTTTFLTAVQEVGNLEPRFAPWHVILNALDAGAIRCEPEYDEGEARRYGQRDEQWLQSPGRRWFLTDWTER
ncbi:MAG: hypothetical protein ACSLE8_07850 [Rhodococcus sp. (in: high G+C Gram-positive bacteria)]